MDKKLKKEKATELAKYIGLKWASGATGPDEYDCQGLVVHIQEKFYNKKMPDVKIDSDNLFAVVKAITKNEAWEKFEKIEKPEDGCLVKMFASEDPSHIGVYIDIDNGGVIHAIRNQGVIWDSMFVLKKTYAQIEFWRFTG